MQPVGLLLLAAGASTRLGRPKQLLPYQGKTLLRHAAEVAAASGCAPLVLVTGALHEELLPEIAWLPFEVVHNKEWEEGMSSGIRAGLTSPPGPLSKKEGEPSDTKTESSDADAASCKPDDTRTKSSGSPLFWRGAGDEVPGAAPLAAIIIIVCDQPLLTPEILRQLISQFQATRQPVVASAYAGVRGVPALFSRDVFAELRALRGPAGARDLLRRYAHLPAVAFPGGAVDVDTAAQYAALSGA